MGKDSERKYGLEEARDIEGNKEEDGKEFSKDKCSQRSERIIVSV